MAWHLWQQLLIFLRNKSALFLAIIKTCNFLKPSFLREEKIWNMSLKHMAVYFQQHAQQDFPIRCFSFSILQMKAVRVLDAWPPVFMGHNLPFPHLTLVTSPLPQVQWNPQKKATLATVLHSKGWVTRKVVASFFTSASKSMVGLTASESVQGGFSEGVHNENQS